MRPNLAEGTLAQGYRVPRGTALRSLLGRGEQTPCEYRTSQDVTLWPLELTHAEYTGYVGDMGDVKLPARRARRAPVQAAHDRGAELHRPGALDDLPLFIRGADELPMKIYEQIMAHAVAIVARPTTRPAPWQHVVTENPIESVGFADEEALLPPRLRSFQGYRLLQEYFAFPSRFFVVADSMASARRFVAATPPRWRSWCSPMRTTAGSTAPSARRTSRCSARRR